MKYDVRVIAKNKIANGWPSAVMTASTKQAGKHVNKGYVYNLFFFLPRKILLSCKTLTARFHPFIWLLNRTTDELNESSRSQKWTNKVDK